jgi:hypothetical protein
MSDLSRNLLDAAREGLSPDAAAMARVRAKVAASVAATTGGAVVAMPVAKAATGLGVKVGLGVLLVAALGGAIVATRSRQGAESARIAITSNDSSETEQGVSVASAKVASQQDVGSARAEPRRSAAPSVTPPRATRRSTPAAEIAVPASTTEPVSLAREVELIDRAMLLVRRGDTRDAIGVIGMFERETRGHGQMAEDASAIEIEARCRLHQEVGEKLSAFDRRWPSSAQRSRLQTLCFARK